MWTSGSRQHPPRQHPLGQNPSNKTPLRQKPPYDNPPPHAHTRYKTPYTNKSCSTVYLTLIYDNKPTKPFFNRYYVLYMFVLTMVRLFVLVLYPGARFLLLAIDFDFWHQCNRLPLPGKLASDRIHATYDVSCWTENPTTWILKIRRILVNL